MTTGRCFSGNSLYIQSAFPLHTFLNILAQPKIMKRELLVFLEE